MYTIAALYHFTRFDGPCRAEPALLAKLCLRATASRARCCLAREGINGTIAGPRAGIDRGAGAYPRAARLRAIWNGKKHQPDMPPFGKMKVRLKNEIVTMGQPDVDPSARVGHYVEPADWNDLIRSPDVAVIDTRNDYEVAIGTFEGAIDPKTAAFGEFPAWWAGQQAPLSQQDASPCSAPAASAAKNPRTI